MFTVVHGARIAVLRSDYSKVNSPSSPSPTPDPAAGTAFQDLAEAQATATVQALIARAAKPAQTELEALRVAIDVRCESLTATLTGASKIDPAPIRELVERLTQAANEEANAAAHAARALALEEADAARELDRAEARKQLEAMRTEAEAQRDADRLERASLSEAIQKATQQAEALRADRDNQLETLRMAREQAEAVRADRDAQVEALRAARERAEAIQADRDAQAEALRAATERAEAIQAERDAKIAALRAAEERAEALRGERDAQIEALRVASELTDSIRADRDAQLQTALAAKEEARTILSEQDALLEAARISNVRHARILEQAQTEVEVARTALAKAQAEAEGRIAAGVTEIQALRSELERARADARIPEQAQAEIDAARAELAAAQTQLTAAQAELVASQAQLAAAHAQLATSEADAERRVADGVGEIEALRSELERVRAEMEWARAEAARPVPTVVNAPIPLVAEPAIEPHAVQLVESTETVPEFDPVVVQTQAYEAQAEPEAAMALPEPEPVQVDPAQAMYQAIGNAADLSQVLDALVDGAGSLFPRAALFVVKTKSKRLQGWRSVGFTGGAAITRDFELPLTTDSALTRAVTASRTIFTGDGQSAAQAEAWTVTFPVTTGGRVVAVVHADAGGHKGETAFDREAALDLGHTLVRLAGERIAALTMSARAAFGNVMSGAPLHDAPVSPSAVLVTPVNDSHVDRTHNGAAAPQLVPAAVTASDNGDAGRYASQLVAEINRYSQAAAVVTAEVAPAVADQNLQGRLADQIEGAHALAPAPAPSAQVSALGLFDEALGKMLGNGGREASVVGQRV